MSTPLPPGAKPFRWNFTSDPWLLFDGHPVGQAITVRNGVPHELGGVATRPGLSSALALTMTKRPDRAGYLGDRYWYTNGSDGNPINHYFKQTRGANPEEDLVLAYEHAAGANQALIHGGKLIKYGNLNLFVSKNKIVDTQNVVALPASLTAFEYTIGILDDPGQKSIHAGLIVPLAYKCAAIPGADAFGGQGPNAYAVSVVNKAGIEGGAVQTTTSLGAPPFAHVDFDWTGSDIVNYDRKIYRQLVVSGVGGPWHLITTVPAGTAAFSDTGIVAYPGDYTKVPDPLWIGDWGLTLPPPDPPDWITTGISDADVYDSRLVVGSDFTAGSVSRAYLSDAGNPFRFRAEGYRQMPTMQPKITAVRASGGSLWLATATELFQLVGTTISDYFFRRQSGGLIGAYNEYCLADYPFGVLAFSDGGLWAIFTGGWPERLDSNVQKYLQLKRAGIGGFDGSSAFCAYSPQTGVMFCLAAGSDVYVRFDDKRFGAFGTSNGLLGLGSLLAFTLPFSGPKGSGYFVNWGTVPSIAFFDNTVAAKDFGTEFYPEVTGARIGNEFTRFRIHVVSVESANLDLSSNSVITQLYVKEKGAAEVVLNITPSAAGVTSYEAAAPIPYESKGVGYFLAAYLTWATGSAAPGQQFGVTSLTLWVTTEEEPAP